MMLDPLMWLVSDDEPLLFPVVGQYYLRGQRRIDSAETRVGLLTSQSRGLIVTAPIAGSAE
jgi:hypothetical protein